ncbi:sodium ion-translocating decarboxylase subunit beta [Fusibacter ferrireducens]|uniref:Sodium ion-translocating decarboxylase subunit beta n=1 Tax=Fusibacter ferrireducens TaxID=2785058 RepID=A0ABR9ZVI1_9FIRM|nr:sodium ion-translocating decarboxylase subunit beta [Fusibacter ferrireducens]MBF4694464.1 sodium ion-translocating decarboxylase subunit beta [Fusibacter ferrireducens]
MKKWMKFVTVISGIFGTLLLMSNWLLKIALSISTKIDLSQHEAASIGIIGGADGPTTIFIGTKTPEFMKLIVVAILYAITVIGIKNWRK